MLGLLMELVIHKRGKRSKEQALACLERLTQNQFPKVLSKDMFISVLFRTYEEDEEPIETRTYAIRVLANIMALSRVYDD